MAGSALKLLFSPIQIGKVTLRNRIVFLPHGINFAIQDLPGEREAYYFAERAKGGVGLIIYGGQFVHQGGPWTHVNALDPNVVDRYKRITDMVHQHGSRIIPQILHLGSRHKESEAGLDWRMPYGPSQWHKEGTAVREMTHDQIKQVVEDHITAARHAKEGEYDGAEVRLNTGLLKEFISPIANRRSDQYGGTIESRMRLPLECINAVRSELGGGAIVGVRMCVDEVVPGGYGVEVGQEIARIVAASGQVDYINTALGAREPMGRVGGLYTTLPYPLPLGHGVYAATAVKQVTSIPAIAHGRINDPFQAEQILAEGKADLIGMARGLIADPQFPNKAKEGSLDDIRKCFGYHDVCQQRNNRDRPVTCVWNPSSGREKQLGIGTLKQAKVAKRVMVIGGGPAGLKLAEVAARRRHQVILYDKDKELGGQINLAVRLPYREHLGEIPGYLTQQLGKLGVEVHTGVEVTPAMVMSSGADTVVVATGSLPYVPPIPGVDQANVVTLWDVARDRGLKGNSILVYDLLGDQASASMIELLLDQGKKVQVVTPQAVVGAGILSETLLAWKRRVDGKPLVWIMEANVSAVSGNNVKVVSSLGTEREWTIGNVDTVVLACGGTPNDGLYRALGGKVSDLRIVGDCEAPLPVERSFYTAELLARAI